MSTSDAQTHSRNPIQLLFGDVGFMPPADDAPPPDESHDIAGVELRTEIAHQLPMEQYATSPGLNQSRAKLFLECPLRFRKHVDVPSQAKFFGSAYHTYLFEPGEFKKHYYTLTDEAKQQILEQAQADGSKAQEYKTLRTDTRAKYLKPKSKDRIVIDQADVDTFANMRDGLQADPLVWEVLEQISEVRGQKSAEVELSVFAPYRYAKTVIQCKARIDLATPDFLLDLKTARHLPGNKPPLKEDAFARVMNSYRYDIQAAWYLELYRLASDLCPLTSSPLRGYQGDPNRRFGFLVQEKSPPYLGAIHWVPADILENARKSMQFLILQYANSIRNDSWEGYGQLTPDLNAMPDIRREMRARGLAA